MYLIKPFKMSKNVFLLENIFYKLHAYYDYAFYIDCSIERIHKIIHTYCDCIGNALDYHNNMKFTTWDQDNDRNSSNCAIRTGDRQDGSTAVFIPTLMDSIFPIKHMALNT